MGKGGSRSVESGGRALRLIALLALLAWGARDAAAGLSVSPLQQELEVKPGATAEFTLTLNNVKRSLTGQRVAVRVEVVDFSVSRTGTLSLGPDCAHPRSAVSWITLNAAEAVLEPDAVHIVKGTVSAPRNADGDYWASLLITPVEPLREKGVSVVLRTACAVFVRVTGRNHVGRLSAGDLSVTLPKFGPPDPSPKAGDAGAGTDLDLRRALTICAVAENAGRIMLTANGRAHLYSGPRKVASIPLHARSRRILPGDLREFVGVLPGPLPAGAYSLRVVFGSDAPGGRRGYTETDFTVDDETARLWADAGAAPVESGLEVAAKPLTLTLQPGRFTTATVPTANRGLGTLQVACRLDGDTIPQGWIALDQDAYTLGPRMRRSVFCRIAIPDGAQSGEYTGRMVFETESAGLNGTPDVEVSTLPVRIVLKR